MMKRLTIIITCILLAGGLCSCNGKYDDSALWEEIDKINSRIDKMNDDIGALQMLVDAMQTGKQVVDVVDTGTGYKIIFSDGSNIILNHGRDGEQGAAAPVVGVKEKDGVYYWTLTADGKTDFIKDTSGNPLPVTGKTPAIAVDSENYWTIDGERISDGNGGFIKATGKDGDSFIKDIDSTADNEVTITLTSGEIIRLTKFKEVAFSFDRTSVVLGYGQSAKITVTQSGVKYTSISKPDGWKAKLTDDRLLVTAPARPNDYAEQSGTISVVAVGETATVVASLEVSADPNVSGGGAGDSDLHNW